jgi:hypothetical protein
MRIETVEFHDLIRSRLDNFLLLLLLLLNLLSLRLLLLLLPLQVCVVCDDCLYHEILYPRPPGGSGRVHGKGLDQVRGWPSELIPGVYCGESCMVLNILQDFEDFELLFFHV